MGVAFVPTNDIFNCFESNYIGEVRRGIRRTPSFHHEMSNIQERVYMDKPRTTNALEGWDNTFSKSLGQSQPNRWIFIDYLKREHGLSCLAINQHDVGRNPLPQKREISGDKY